MSSSFLASLSKDKIQKYVSEDEFMKSVSSEQVTSEQFYAWLAQYYLLEIHHFRLVAKNLVNADRSDYEALSEELVELADQLAWVEKKLRLKGVNIKDVKLADNHQAYQNWYDQILKSGNVSYLSLMIATYAHDICRYEKWKSVTSRVYKDFASRWASKDVGDAMEELEMDLDKAAVEFCDTDREEARKVWDTVIAFETGL